MEWKNYVVHEAKMIGDDIIVLASKSEDTFFPDDIIRSVLVRRGEIKWDIQSIGEPRFQISPDEKFVLYHKIYSRLTFYKDNLISVCDARSGKDVFPSKNGHINACASFTSSNMIVIGMKKCIEVYRFCPGKQQFELVLHSLPIDMTPEVCFSDKHMDYVSFVTCHPRVRDTICIINTSTWTMRKNINLNNHNQASCLSESMKVISRPQGDVVHFYRYAKDGSLVVHEQQGDPADEQQSIVYDRRTLIEGSEESRADYTSFMQLIFNDRILIAGRDGRLSIFNEKNHMECVYTHVFSSSLSSMLLSNDDNATFVDLSFKTYPFPDCCLYITSAHIHERDYSRALVCFSDCHTNSRLTYIDFSEKSKHTTQMISFIAAMTSRSRKSTLTLTTFFAQTYLRHQRLYKIFFS